MRIGVQIFFDGIWVQGVGENCFDNFRLFVMILGQVEIEVRCKNYSGECWRIFFGVMGKKFKSDLGLGDMEIVCGKVEIFQEWRNLRKGDQWEKNAWSVKVYFIFVMEELGNDQVEEILIFIGFCDFVECGEFSCLSYGDWYSFLIIK